jgi:murein DD-endopeptidase MepM/ murein hydrolase activator NlpD
MRAKGFLLALLSAFLLAAGSCRPASAETVRLSSVSVEAKILGGRPYCYISEQDSFRWIEGELIPLSGLFSYYPENSWPLQPSLAYTPEVSRGEVLKGYVVFSEQVDRLEVTLKREEDGFHSTVRGFPLDEEEGTWFFLCGVPSTAAAGSYHFTISGSRGKRFFIYLGKVQVIYREFRSERIAFNQALTELMTSTDPRKLEESRQLQEILSSFHVKSLFETGSFQIPVQATWRSSLFADRRLYSYSDGGSSRSLHNGVDLAAPEGTPVEACGAGRVVLAGERIIPGNTVVIEHLPGVFSLYYHLHDLEVQVGQRVFQGQRIGTVGMTGLATGPHLHWEVRVCGVAVDPDIFVDEPIIDKAVFSDNIMDQIPEEGR